MKDQETAANKIMKLLAKAESTTPEEAEALTAKAQELMAEYAISEAMIQAARGVITETIVEHSVKLQGIYQAAHVRLGQVIGDANDCRVFQVKYSHSTTLHYVGFENDVSNCEVLLTSLMIQASVALRKFSKEWKAKYSYLGGMDAFKSRRDFLFGFADGVAPRLKKAREEAAQTVEADRVENPTSEAAAASSVALVLVSRKKKVEDHWQDNYAAGMRKVHSRMSSGVGGRAAGRAAGAAASLPGSGVGSGVKGSLK